jgi:hypothetical protein
VIASDRKGTARGCWWFENPGQTKQPAGAGWKRHPIGGQGQEVMFLARGDADGDGREDLVVPTRRGDLLILRRTDSAAPAWETQNVPVPAEAGGGKSVAIGDMDLDGQADLVFSCEGAEGKHGVMWLSQMPAGTLSEARWTAHAVSGTAEGVKYDLVELLDLDGDGDLDVLTCEERDNLGVVWYENPTRGS